MSDVADILERAADRLSKPKAWTQKAAARNRDGHLLCARERSATCWCAVGAIRRETDYDYEAENATIFLEKALLPPGSGIGLRPLARWNDAPERTQAEVVAKLREGALRARHQKENPHG